MRGTLHFPSSLTALRHSTYYLLGSLHSICILTVNVMPHLVIVIFILSRESRGTAEREVAHTTEAHGDASSDDVMIIYKWQ